MHLCTHAHGVWHGRTVFKCSSTWPKDSDGPRALKLSKWYTWSLIAGEESSNFFSSAADMSHEKTSPKNGVSPEATCETRSWPTSWHFTTKPLP